MVRKRVKVQFLNGKPSSVFMTFAIIWSNSKRAPKELFLDSQSLINRLLPKKHSFSDNLCENFLPTGLFTCKSFVQNLYFTTEKKLTEQKDSSLKTHHFKKDQTNRKTRKATCYYRLAVEIEPWEPKLMDRSESILRGFKEQFSEALRNRLVKTSNNLI